ncbi:hypothetical protein DFH09DRAFT_1183927, partial [Mycena vulgaris]
MVVMTSLDFALLSWPSSGWSAPAHNEWCSLCCLRRGSSFGSSLSHIPKSNSLLFLFRVADAAPALNSSVGPSTSTLNSEALISTRAWAYSDLFVSQFQCMDRSSRVTIFGASLKAIVGAKTFQIRTHRLSRSIRARAM